MFSVFFKLLPSLLADCTAFSISTFVTLRFVLLTESWEERNILELYIFWNYHGYSNLCFTACIQLIKVSTIFVCLGRGLLVKDTESQEDQYLFEICPYEHSEKDCHQIAISWVSSFPSHFPACPQLESINLLYLLGRGLLVHSAMFQDAQNNKTIKTSSSAMEKVKEECSTHEESSSSDQEQEQEVFFPTISGTSCPKYFHALHRRS